jgi:hypothetical protein
MYESAKTVTWLFGRFSLIARNTGMERIASPTLLREMTKTLRVDSLLNCFFRIKDVMAEKKKNLKDLRAR